MQLLRGDADLAAQPKDATIGEPRGCVCVHNGSVDSGEKRLARLVGVAHDGL